MNESEQVEQGESGVEHHEVSQAYDADDVENDGKLFFFFLKLAIFSNNFLRNREQSSGCESGVYSTR